MARYATNKRRDKKIFRATATKIKKINVLPNVMRGGFRL